MTTVEVKPRQLRFYPQFENWLMSLDVNTRARIDTRLIKITNGNLGDHRSIGDGVSEFRFDFGPGPRIYFGQIGDKIFLLTGGDKDTQSRDIPIAKEIWRKHNA